MEQQSFDFSGKTYDAARDRKRLNTHFHRVQNFMSDLRWHTLREISEATRGSEATSSARFRDLKNLLGWETDHRHVENGIWEYRVVSFGVKQ